MSSEHEATGIQRYTEDLAQLAATQYRIADQACDTCRDYHALWPYHRLAGVVGGAKAGSLNVERVLSEAFNGGHRKVLIAGTADTGLLALTARVGIPFGVEIVVLDRCATPLALCRQFAQDWSLRADMLHRDLTNLDIKSGFDVVLASSILAFIAPDQRVDVLSRLHGALRPNGRLINVVNVSARVSGEAMPQYRADYSQRMLAELERRGVALPESAEAFTHRLEHYAREFESRQGAFGDLDQVLMLHRRAGFAIMSCTDTETGLAAPWRQVVAKLAKRRYVIVAERASSRSGD
jgi:SAM-dependent methyltransferase